MCPVNYGTEGIRLRNYRVYVCNDLLSEGDIATAAPLIKDMFVHLAAFEYCKEAQAFTQFSAALDEFAHVGEFRKDSIDLSVGDGDSVEGNEVGKIVFGKNCTFVGELINATPDNINTLHELDQTETLVILYEIDGRPALLDKAISGDQLLLSLDAHEMIFIMNCPAIKAGLTSGVGKNLSISDKLTGSAIPTATMTVEDANANGASGFRTILDMPFSIEDALVISKDSPTTTTIEIADMTSRIVADGYYVDVSLNSGFTTFVTGTNSITWNKYYLPRLSADTFVVIGLTTGTTYYIRAWAAINGQRISSVSNVVTSTTD